jgi:hypothetical protein
LTAALSLASELGIDEPRAATWTDRLERLADFHTDPEFGLNVAKNLPFEQPHRHFSHVMGAVLKDPRLLTTADGVALVSKSVKHWRSLRDPCSMPLPRPVTRDQGPIKDAGWTGFSFAVSSLLHSRLQLPAEAVADVTWMAEHSTIDGKVGARSGNHVPSSGPCPPDDAMSGSVLHPNTFYAEGVGDPTGETPFGTVAALQELLVGTTAVDETIAVFPGFGNGSVATKIGSACFHDLRVSGAFLVSGCFANASTTFATVHSEAGRRCRVQLPSMTTRSIAVEPPTVAMSISVDGTVELALAAGQTATLYSKAGPPLSKLAVKVMPIGEGDANFWGQKPKVKTDDGDLGGGDKGWKAVGSASVSGGASRTLKSDDGSVAHVLRDDSVGLTPPRGWLSWGRYRCFTDCALSPDDCIGERLVMRTAHALVDGGFAAAGYTLVSIDSCWTNTERGPNGELVANVSRFPRGIKPIADELHAMNLTLGMVRGPTGPVLLCRPALCFD